MSRIDTSPGRAQSAVDLSRLAPALVGQTRLEEVLARALDALVGAHPESAWAVLYRLGPARFRAASSRCVTHRDLRRLANATCGSRARLAVGVVARGHDSLAEPTWATVGPGRRADHREPSLVLARWHASPRQAGTDRRLAPAARLIAAAADAAVAFERLEEQNQRDALTGLLNRAGILEALRREMERAARDGTTLSVLFVDVDRFKEINDRYGHRVGDAALEAVACRLVGALRASDTVGRLGGDEFLALLPDTDLAAAGAIARRLVAPAQPDAQPGALPRPGLSAGVAASSETTDPQALVEIADRRMLGAKAGPGAKTPQGRFWVVVPPC